MRFLILFIFLITNSYADEAIDIKNLIINKELKKYDELTFLDINNNQLNLKDFEGNLILINFWAHGVHLAKKKCHLLIYYNLKKI